MNKRTLLILGARSDMAMAIAHRFAKSGYNLQLAARNCERLHDDKLNIEIRYQVSVSLHEFDVLEIESHVNFPNTLSELPNVIVCAVGYMGDQLDSECDFAEASKVMRTNYVGPTIILSAFANAFEQRGSGIIVAISSVAGERGRASNYVYGSSKAGFTAFLSGLRNRLAMKGVHVITVLPGFVETRMLTGAVTPKLLTVYPEKIADSIMDAVKRKSNIVYSQWQWRAIMMIIKSIPEFIFKRTNL